MDKTQPILRLVGTLRLSTPDAKRTVGRFNELITDNSAVFRRYFGVDLFPGSLNVDVPTPASLQRDLDGGRPPPAFIIPKGELINMPRYIGDGQAWPCLLCGETFQAPVPCWIFRRIGSRVSPGVIEILAQHMLRDAYALQHGEAVTIDLIAPQAISDLGGQRSKGMT
jgi:CTP-dependent riboflavin kinase